jgi:hypothetical protein
MSDGAREHGAPDADTRHAVANALRSIARNGSMTLFIGPDRTGRLLEVVVLDDDPNEEPVVVHSMPLRKSYYRFLER